MLEHPYGARTEDEKAELAERLADDLETLAGIVRRTPQEVELWWSLLAHASTYASADGFRRFVTALTGEVHTDQAGGRRGWAKAFTGDSASVTGWVGSAVRLVLYTARDGVCRRVVTGTKTVTERDYTAAPLITREVEEVEWQCEPFLAD